MIEINSDDIQKFTNYYSSKLKIRMNEKYGELRVFNRETEKSMAKVYVKVFCKDNSGKEKFYRDGFTDIRGKFEYANASGKSVSDVKKFGILIADKVCGSCIKEADPPKNSKDSDEL